mmetsp:Transcript_7324/g.20557  ORF Transcript_7324/g.20557 Transcript_7324/m.20557 type:complete len:763 (-) Transcript_7324:314-2602(-)
MDSRTSSKKTYSREVLSATRLHFPAGTQAIPPVTEQNLRSYAAATKALGVPMAIAVNCLQEEVARILSEAEPEISFQVLHVPVWGAFVPALNTLLGEALRQGMPYILYQSLEVCCAPDVLKKLMDHHTSDTLVVGPVLDGHVFEAGEQPLNGRSTPWNTLALWSTRKLALTGFLHIADGLPKNVKGQGRPGCPEGARDPLTDELVRPGTLSSAMGSEGWWATGALAPWQAGGNEGGIPAGVEEVTVIALLQHLLGEGHARGILVQLPEEHSMVSWNTNWEGDVKRKQWHEYKMASKISRPAAQINELFNGGDQVKKPISQFPCPSRAPEPASCSSASEDVPQMHRGSVLHLSESIRPSKHVEWICSSCFALFSINFAIVFAKAFETMNAEVSLSNSIFVALLIGGIYIPMPLSLWLTRQVIHRADHFAGLIFFVLTLLIPHSATALGQLNGSDEHMQRTFFLMSRFVQGLGSGILFQARFVLACQSTHDHHLDIQARNFLANDVGLAIGALLPYLASNIVGHEEFFGTRPELFSSAAIALLSLLLLAWLFLAFPRRLHQLPNAVRFPASTWAGEKAMKGHSAGSKRSLLISGTARVFVQSSAIVALALWMRDAGLVGSFRQTKAMAAVLSVGTICTAWLPQSDKDWQYTKIKVIAVVGAVMVLFLCTSVGLLRPETDGAKATIAALELVTLLAALALAAPHHVSRLYQLKDAEQAIVILEWLKAYVGRLFAPIFAIAVQAYLGYGPLLVMLSATTISVAFSA